MEIYLESKDIRKYVKNYYKEHTCAKNIKVKLISESVRDRIQEIDLFYHGDVYFNIFFYAQVTGLVPGRDKKYYKMTSTVNEESLREIVTSELSKEFDVKDLKFGYRILDDHQEPGIEINFTRAKVQVEPKNSEKKLIIVKNK